MKTNRSLSLAVAALAAGTSLNLSALAGGLALYEIGTPDVGLAYEFLWGGAMSVDQGVNNPVRGRVSGSYNDTWFCFASLSLGWKF
jgi:hypothetical protein